MRPDSEVVEYATLPVQPEGNSDSIAGKSYFCGPIFSGKRTGNVVPRPETLSWCDRELDRYSGFSLALAADLQVGAVEGDIDCTCTFIHV